MRNKFSNTSGQGRIQDLGRGGGLITIVTIGMGTGGGVSPPVTAKGSGAKPQPLILLLRLFSMKIFIILSEIYQTA